LEDVDPQPLHERAEAAVGLRPRHLDLHHSELRAFDPRITGMDQRAELAGIEMAPLPLGRLVVAGHLTATMRAVPTAAFGMLDVHVKSVDSTSRLPFVTFRGAVKPRNLLAELRVEHASFLRGIAALSPTKLPTKIPD